MAVRIKTICSLFLVAGMLTPWGCHRGNSDGVTEVRRQPVIFPDYAGITLPPNIAPLNFILREEADAYRVTISPEEGRPIVIKQSSPGIRIPAKRWHAMLQANAGKVLHISVETRKQGKWARFMPFNDTIAPEPVDGYLAYRRINTGYILWRDMQIAQRNLTNFDERFLFRNSSADQACANCHAFCGNDHRKMSMHIRRAHAGTLIADGKSL